MKLFLSTVPRFLFFTGKGGVGKTSMASCTAVGLADMGRRVLLISTDPASNLDEVFGEPLSSSPRELEAVPRLFAMNINPIHAAAEYRERMIGPYRGVLPEAAVQQMEEQLSGACTVEIAGFNEFSKFIGDEAVSGAFDHIILDTAPTGHTLRLLNLPAAWTDFMAENPSGSSCLGPVAGLADQKILFEKVVQALSNPAKTQLILVSRPEGMSLTEAARASRELRAAGMYNQYLILNGVFEGVGTDPVARAFAAVSEEALAQMPDVLRELPSMKTAFRAAGIMGTEAMREVIVGRTASGGHEDVEVLNRAVAQALDGFACWEDFIDGLEAAPNGVIMTMGKGGVGKTTMAALIASELAGRGHSVLLTTTDPAAHLEQVIGPCSGQLQVDRIHPEQERARYVESILAKSRGRLSADELALLEEELRSPCIEEIAVFQAFARTVAQGTGQYIVLDTAPTGHTLLLLDSTQAYHREVARSSEDIPEEVKALLPRIRDPQYTRVAIVALAEATPVHEAAALQEDLRRAGIEPYGWIVNRSFAVSGTADPVLCSKGMGEIPYMNQVARGLARRAVISPWRSPQADQVAWLNALMSHEQNKGV
jgi:arsenite/tail-anchored protein-transporting ATPase